MLELRHFDRFFGWIPRSRIPRCSSEAIHFHHFRRRGHFRRGGSTKGGLCLGSFVGMGWDFLVAFGMPWKKGKEKWEKNIYVFFLQAFPPEMKAKTAAEEHPLTFHYNGCLRGRTNLSKWKENKLVEIVVYPLLPVSPFHLGLRR